MRQTSIQSNTFGATSKRRNSPTCAPTASAKSPTSRTTVWTASALTLHSVSLSSTTAAYVCERQFKPAISQSSLIHGDPVAGGAKFASMCASCHGDRGTMGITNPGSTDGTVPVLNPIDPGFLADSNGDASIFARELDVFLQHGSRPAGPSPLITMPGFGDQHLVPQNDIADIEAYVMQLNGTFWPDRCPGIQLELANPSPGARVELGHYVVQGRAVDARAKAGSGIDRVDFFLDSRDSGGRFIGTTSPPLPPGPAGPPSLQ